ncbi:MAG: four helix bundle protein [Bacteroidales bacterium]|nr:four helix bundle protein [Bacteroidales bacterium]MCF8343794.1 four helix bundle protein [Bacteroidales bacterium]MCF8376743.1 four helix bundle protein [Bacteroidales bacterium]
MTSYKGFKDLIVFQKSYDLAIRIHKITRKYPSEEKYLLVDQIIRSSRSVPANIAEAWAKRLYTKAFISKLSDALGEELETEVWLEMSKDHQYITPDIYEDLFIECDSIRKMLISMMNNPGKFCR